MICAFRTFCYVYFGILCYGTGFGKTVDPEVYMNTTELIRSKGYPCEEHQVYTSDGYILDIQRIPHGKNRRTHNGAVSTKGAVLLMHGLLSCSACWVENLANESFGFILADAGYDVWLGNCRGNTYGRQHERLNVNESEFWAFSSDEMALSDLPATVDLVLKVSGQKQLVYVGHSQGTEIAFAALSQIDDLNDKIRLFVAFGPAAYLGHVKSPIRLLRHLTNTQIHKFFGDKEFLPKSAFLSYLADAVCYIEIPGLLCENVLFLLCGYDSKNMNESRIPVYVGQHPAGTSVQNMIHYVQDVNTDKFQMFDYGPVINMKKYNKTSPPEYPLGKVRTQVALYAGGHDWLTTITDVDRIWRELPTKPYYTIFKYYDHLDFIWSMDAANTLYKDVLSKL